MRRRANLVSFAKVYAFAVCAVALAGCISRPVEVPPSPPEDPTAGILTLPDGRIVRIHPDQLDYSGGGRFEWPDGREYEGEFKAGMPNGIGREILPDGTRYSGTWLEGIRHGHGELSRPDGSRYVGDFVQGLRQGDGSEETSRGLYRGRWEQDRPHGQGSFHANTGAVYEGSWHQGQRHGTGEHTDAEGNTYKGDWSQDKAHGFGMFQAADGSTYDGQWRTGKRDGYGVLSHGDRASFRGTWRAGKRHGYGLAERADASSYLGEWENDQRHGRGRETNPDGSYHDGQWEFDQPLGPGTRANHYGLVISGLWNNEHVSTGLLTLPSGLEYAGNLFRNNNQEVASGLLDWLEANTATLDPYVELLLATVYQDFTVPRPNPERARTLLQKAAAAGIAEAQYRLAVLEVSGNAPRAIELLFQAANQGHATANETLADYYYTGQLVPQNRATAARYYQQAMAAGSRKATNNLAWLLATSNDPSTRDGARAIELIEPLARLFDDWQHLDTLAAAYAETGRFEAAVASQTKAIERANRDEELTAPPLSALRQRLEFYEQRQPYRDD